MEGAEVLAHGYGWGIKVGGLLDFKMKREFMVRLGWGFQRDSVNEQDPSEWLWFKGKPSGSAGGLAGFDDPWND